MRNDRRTEAVDLGEEGESQAGERGGDAPSLVVGPMAPEGTPGPVCTFHQRKFLSFYLMSQLTFQRREHPGRYVPWEVRALVSGCGAVGRAQGGVHGGVQGEHLGVKVRQS